MQATILPTVRISGKDYKPAECKNIGKGLLKARYEIGKDHLIAKITAEGEIDARWCSGKREARRLYAIL